MQRIQKNILDTKLGGTNLKLILNPSELEMLQKPDAICVTKQ
jgi:hypothetical protein